MKKIYAIAIVIICTLLSLNSYATKHIIQAGAGGNTFTPSTVNAYVGDTIRWEYVSGSHTTTCQPANYPLCVKPAGALSWNHALNSSNLSFEYVLTVAGNYHYICVPHAPSMSGDLIVTIPPNPMVNITFSVDMSQTTICANGPHIAGSFNGWNPAATPLTDVGGGIYQVTLALDSTQTYEYKFLKDNDWPCGDESVPSACAVNNNRQIITPEADATLPTVCFGSCSACVINPLVNITFRVDLSQEVICAGGPHIAGQFNGWDPNATPLTAVGGGVYEVTLALDSTQTYEYKFLKDSDWTCGSENVPGACNVNGNRFLETPEADATLPTVCFSSCSACVVVPPPGMVNVTFSVDMSQTTICANGPHIAGSFNGWNPAATPLNSVGAGVYQVTLLLDSTQTYEYKFLKDNDWACGDESVPSACAVNNNRQLITPETDSILPTVCFGSCSACVALPPNDSVNITFSVDLSQQTICAGGPHIAGSFNGWNTVANPLTAVGGGVYQATILLDSTQTYEYKFLLDDTWNCTNENIPAACNVNGNRQLITPEASSILPTVCFSSCSACVATGNDSVNVTFQVDLSQETICAGGPHIAGQFNGWNPNATPLNYVGLGVYAVTLKLDSTQIYEYKFLKDSDWTCGGENIPSACSVNGNRLLVTPEADAILPVVCFNSCSACIPPPPADSVHVTFRVDLSQETICAGGPHIAGSFNNWSTTANPLTAIGGGVYEATLLLDTTITYEYKFLKDSDWTCGGESVPSACAVNNNRQLITPETDSVLPTVCFSSCSACVINTKVNVTFRVDVSQHPCTAGLPHLVGSFNGWNATATPMTAVGAGVYEATVNIDSTLTVQYKFLNDSAYSACGNENVPSACGVPNGFGGFNRELVIPEGDVTLPTVCLSSCSACVPLNMVNVTFKVDMALTTLGPGGPHIAGTFNGFNAAATPMTNIGGAVYAYSLILDTTLTVQYTFLKDSTYNGQEVITNACGVPNGFGGFNRELIIPQTDTVLPAVCYSSCFVCNVGINNNTGADAIAVYPNPTENTINIQLPANHENSELKIISMDGKLVYSKKVDANSSQIVTIDMSIYAKGIYTLEVLSAKQSSYKKIVRQ